MKMLRINVVTLSARMVANALYRWRAKQVASVHLDSMVIRFPQNIICMLYIFIHPPGEYCDELQDYCALTPCENGQCLNVAEGYYCKCPPGIIGKRCHLQPCDYTPCHPNAICENLMVFPASRSSYICHCPQGLTGIDCTQTIDPCRNNSCKNNANCVALNPSESMDDSSGNHINYDCMCPPYFYGQFCETLITPDYIMEFSVSGVNDYVEIGGPANDLNEVCWGLGRKITFSLFIFYYPHQISVCVWIQTSDADNYGTVLSYATADSDNMFTLTDYNG